MSDLAKYSNSRLEHIQHITPSQYQSLSPDPSDLSRQCHKFRIRRYRAPQTRLDRLPPPPHLILKSEPKLDILLQPLSKAVTPKLPQKVPSTTQPSEKLLPVGSETLQIIPNAVQLGLLPAGTGDSSIVAEPVQSLPQAQTSQLAPPMPSAQAKVPKLSNSTFTPPRLTLPSQLPRLKHHEYLSQSAAALNYDYSSPELQPTLNVPHQKPSLPQAPPKQLTVSQARSILKVSIFAEPSEIRAAYWSLEFEYHPHRYHDKQPAVQSVIAEKLAEAQEAVDKLRGFIGTCWDLEKDFEDFKRSE
ncbi:hypothetical protein OEA41_006086 [Lepraria neglecta]|uniref:Uncharacterized protein n=1 Tax=Lepraria neglecta TaxID=209136 RepID=A0AAD9ZAK2_9LECA|nr:hypothetical protein OEA41_006086 [Lepraria neglecta]